MNTVVYLFPALINFILGGMFFITAYRFSDAGAGSVVTGLSMTCWAVLYCLMSPLLGRVTTPKNAPRLIMAGGVMIAAAAIGFLIFSGLYTQFVWIALTGIGGAFYCTPIQVFMKSIETNRNTGVVRATGLYTASWSVGLASGPLVFGLFSVRTGFVVNAVLAVLVVFGVEWVRRFAAKRPRPSGAPEPEVTPPPVEAVSKHPDLAWLGWLIGGIGTFSICQVRTMWQYRGVSLGIDREQIGMIVATVSYVQALTALLLLKSRSWMYRVIPAILIGAAGVIGLCAFAMPRCIPLFFAGAALYGVYSGCFYFYLVYHSLAHPTRAARYVATNEVVVGVTSIVGPVAGGVLANEFNSAAPFVGVALLVLLAAVFQAVVTRRVCS